MLSEVPEGWAKRTLGEIISLEYGKSLPEKIRINGDYPVYGSAGIVGTHNEYLVKSKSIVVGRKGTVGAVYKTSQPFFPIDTTYYVVAKNEVNWEWLTALLESLQLANLNEATGVPGLNRERAYKSEVFIPPLIEQNRIAEALSSVDASIQATQAVIKQAERLKHGLMEELLTGDLGSEAIERGELPEGWVITKLADLTTKIGSGVTPKGGKKAYVESGFQLIRSQNVGWGEMLLDDVAFITPEQHEKMGGTKLRNGDVLLNITGASIGRSAIYDGETGAANVNQHVCILRTKEVLAAGYLNAWLLSHAGQKTIDTFQAGGNRQGLNFQQIGSFAIPLPPLSEQQRIVEIISSVDELIAQEKSVVEQQARAKRGLMDDLLTGKVRTV